MFKFFGRLQDVPNCHIINKLSPSSQCYPRQQDVAPKWMMGAALGHCFVKMWTWAITSCRVIFSSAAHSSKLMSLTLFCLSPIWSLLMSNPNSCSALAKFIHNRPHVENFFWSLKLYCTFLLAYLEPRCSVSQIKCYLLNSTLKESGCRWC